MQNKLEVFVVELLEKKLSPVYCYHNIRHTLFVHEKVIEIGTHEGCSRAELALLRAAALWHDTGYINTPNEHEKESCLLARQYLPSFGYPEKDIDSICSIIMATKMPHQPKNKPDEIIADADLAYLGTSTAVDQAADLFREWQRMDSQLTKAAWDDMQISFLIKHHFFTDYAKKSFGPGKQTYLQGILNGIE